MSFRGKIFWSGAGAFVLGLILSSLDFNFPSAVYFFAVAVLIIIFSLIKKNRTLIILGIAIFSFSLALFRFDIVSSERLTSRELRTYQNLETNISGSVIDVEKRQNGFRTTIKAEKIGEDEPTFPVGIIVRHDGQAKALPGDYATFSGVLEIPEPFQTDSGRTFDYPKYLEARGVSLILDDAEVVSFISSKNSFRQIVYNLRTQALAVFGDLSPRVSALISGMTLGARESIPDSLNDAMVRTGTIHIVALSGFNVTLVSLIIIYLLTSFFGKRSAYIPAGISIILFVILAGGGSPAIRSAVIAVLYLLSQHLGSNYSIARALIFAFCIMLFSNPFLLTDLSFQLSFLATIGIIYIPKRIERYFKWVPEKWSFRDIVLISISAQIAVLPLLIYETGVLSVISIPINVLITPLVPAIMVLGFISALLSIFGSMIAYPVVLFTGFVTDILIWIIEKGAELPVASVVVPEMSISMILIIYSIIIYFFYIKTTIKKIG